MTTQPPARAALRACSAVVTWCSVHPYSNRWPMRALSVPGPDRPSWRMRRSLRRVDPPCLLAKLLAQGHKQVLAVTVMDAGVADAIQGVFGKFYGQAVNTLLCD
jgi:hypothetical protein